LISKLADFLNHQKS